MNSIVQNVKSEIIINKSRFINYLIKVDNVDEVKIELDKLRDIYRDATHHCFAYVIDEIRHASDDGEPSKTAGMPMLNVLESSNLNHVLAVTIRYFGGIKLGAGGLVRAYTKSVTESLKLATIASFEPGYKIDISFAYELKDLVISIIGSLEVVNKVFGSTINYTIICGKEDYEQLSTRFKENQVVVNWVQEVLIKK